MYGAHIRFPILTDRPEEGSKQYDKRDAFSFSIVDSHKNAVICLAICFITSIVAEVFFCCCLGALAEELNKYLKRTFNRHSEDLCHITDNTGIFMKMVLG